MKKKCLTLIGALWLALTINAEKVNLQKAEQLATNYVVSQHKPLRKSNVNLTLKHVATPAKSAKKTVEETVYYYIFDIDQTGFIIISGDDVAKPVLGYSGNGNFDADNLPSGLDYLLNLYQSQIARAQAENTPQSEDIRKQWAAYLEGRIAKAGETVGPLVKTKWDQFAPYNDLCPLVGSRRCVTGCVATAMSQIMNYHEFPQTGIGTAGAYTLESGVEVPLVDLEVDYDWNNMLDVYPGSMGQYTPQQRNSVATLMYHSGVSVSMGYTPGESGARASVAATAFPKNFGYDKSAREYLRSNYAVAQWDSMLRAQIDAGLPILYGGSASSGAHAFVCDGYDGDGKFHFNFGWSGSSDGFYATSAMMTYQDNQHAVMDIKPVQGRLKDVQVSAGTFFPQFRHYIFDYKLRVDASVESVDITGITDMEGITVDGNVTALPLELNKSVEVKIKATHSDGSVQTYRISVVRGEEPPFSFRWDMTEYDKKPTVGFTTEKGRPCIIDWGDGQTQTVEGNDLGNYDIMHEYSTPGTYQVTVRSAEPNDPYTPLDIFRKRTIGYPIRDINLIPASRLTSLQIENFEDTVLDLSRLHYLSVVMCSNGKLTSLIVDESNALTELRCDNNEMPLVSMHNLLQRTKGVRTRVYSPQLLPAVETPVGIPIAIDTLFYGEDTRLSVSGKTNYTFENGEITFLSRGGYTVVLSNPAIADGDGRVQFYQMFTATSDYSAFTVNITAPVNGTLNVLEGRTSISTGAQVDSGVVLTLTATPAQGYVFEKWWDNDTSRSRSLTVISDTTISATFSTATAILDMENENVLNVYPNPVTNNKLVVECPEHIDGLIQIYDLQGKLVLSHLRKGTQTEVDVSRLPEGLYVVKIGEISTKIVKQ